MSYNNLVKSIGKIAQSLQSLSRQAAALYAPEVDAIINSKSKDTDRIEHVLDGMLGFCNDDSLLALFKKLCQYYYTIDPLATAQHIYAYREMWDSDERTDKKKIGNGRMKKDKKKTG